MQTLEDFNNMCNVVDGHYAVWTSAMIPHGEGRVYGFSGAVVEYTNREGFKNYPKWMDEMQDAEIKIALLEELPSVEELGSIN